MSPFKPNQELTLDNDTFLVAPHPSAPKLAFAQEGAKGTVYQIVRKQDKRRFALKVFKERFREVQMIELSRKLANFAHLPGMQVCERQVIQSAGYGKDAITKYPELEYAVVMPWSIGRTWFDVISSRASIIPQVGIEIARRTAEILATLEKNTLAHCDVSSGNLLIDVDTLGIELIDVEDMYSPQFQKPSAIPHGTDGYNHKQARSEGQWRPEGDRFSGAVIIAEMLCWHDTQIRDSSTDEGTFFAPDEMQDQASKRYRVISNALRSLQFLPSGVNVALVEKFKQAWSSTTLRECPDMKEWSSLLDGAVRAPAGTKLTNTEITWPVTGWKEIRQRTSATYSPIDGFTQIATSQALTVKPPRLLPMANHDGKGAFTVRWMPIREAETYEIEQAKSAQFDAIVFSSQTSALSLKIENCRKGTYHFRVRSVQGQHRSAWSAPIQVTVWSD